MSRASNAPEVAIKFLSNPPAVSRQFWLTTCLCFLAIWTLNAELPPSINESHYLTKAQHAWDPTFAPHDLFLSSGNAHWLFANIAGWMSSWLSLPGVAWVGRLGCWMLMSFAWSGCARRLGMSPIHAACVLAGWMLATRIGNWAGEWAVGGFEAKSISYGLVMLAISSMLAGAWPRVWIYCGMAVAFHPLVGGWAGLSLLQAWLWFGRDQHGLWSQLVKQLPSMLIAGCISMVGIIPAVAMISGPSREGDIVIAQIHAFYRLAHHQTPHLFWASQHIAGACTLLLFSCTSLALHWSLKKHPSPGLESLRALTRLGWLSIAISGVGLIIDLAGVRIRPDITAGLLRFYWFRWSDIMVPLAWVSTAWMLGLWWQRPALDLPASHTLTSSKPKEWPANSGLSIAGLLLSTACALTLAGTGWRRVSELMSTSVSPADRTMLMSESPTLASGPEVVDEWLALCNWVRENTPPDSLFLTPRAQQTFKWYAQRAEVATFKDVPQDSKSLLEWYDRIGRIAPPRDAELQPLGWTDQKMLALHKRFKFDYVIVDRRIQKSPLRLQLVYPEAQRMQIVDGTYAIYKLPAP